MVHEELHANYPLLDSRMLLLKDKNGKETREETEAGSYVEFLSYGIHDTQV